MSVGIIGGRGTGKTVFVSLLATTAINYSVESKYHFRYYTAPEFTAVIGEIVESLKLQKWPPATLKGSLSEYRFWFGYSSTLTRALNKLYDQIEKFASFIKRLEISRRELFNIIEFGVYDIAGEDVDIIMHAAAAAKQRGISVIDMIPENLRAVLDTDVLVFLIDSSKITTDINDPTYKEMLEYDNLMASLMSLVAMYRSSKYGYRAGKLYPVFVFTKFDVLDRKVLRSIGIPDNFDRWFEENSRDRKLIVEKLMQLMRRFFQHTLALIYGGTLMGVELERAQMFVSYLMTELNEEGIPVPKVVKALDGVSYDLVYSRNEYKRFIDYFGKIAGEIKRTQKEPGAYVTGLGR
jgi:hypothetical protein